MIDREQVARVVEQAARLADVRVDTRRGELPDPVRFAGMAARVGAADAARIGNRLRATVAESRRGYGAPADVDRVPFEPLGEVWDAPIRVWEWAGTTHHTAAVTVSHGVYLDTYQGPYEGPRDHYGTQVVARATTAGHPPVYAVFWHRAEGASWWQVTAELTESEMTGWDGIPLPVHRCKGTGKDLAGWLHLVAAVAN